VCVCVCVCVCVHVQDWSGKGEVPLKQAMTLHCFTLLLHCCYAVVALLLHCCHTVVTLLLYCCYTIDLQDWSGKGEVPLKQAVM
jgi:ABC-type transport system involved in Fe-S cluster assembly fused permease/ATPase subunit